MYKLLNLAAKFFIIKILVQLSCKADGFQLSGWSLKLFNGTFKIKKAKEKHCERFFKDVYEFQVDIKYDECGIQRIVGCSF